MSVALAAVKMMSRLRNWLPAWITDWHRSWSGGVHYQSDLRNIYHCTVQKSASQWVRAILSDPRIFAACSLTSRLPNAPGTHDPRTLTERTYSTRFPDHSIITPIYLAYEGFASLPKQEPYRAFFVMRDPRDVVVSWYFSARYSHRAMGEIERVRAVLADRSLEAGLCYAIDYLRDFGLFAAQRSWAGADIRDPNVLLLRYEDLIGEDQAIHFQRLMDHCQIRIAPPVLLDVLAAHSFEGTTGRSRGQEDVHAHNRKGIAGDWRNHFDASIEAHFHTAAGNVLELWNYA